MFIFLIGFISLWALFCANFFLDGKKKFIIVTMLVLSILIAFRANDVGADTKAYYLTFNEYAKYNINEMLNVVKSGGVEIGYLLLVKFLSVIFSEPQSIFIFEGCIIGICYGYFFQKNTKNLIEAYIAILAYLGFNLFAFQLTGVRQSIAMAICILSYEYIKEKSFIKFISIVLFASLFHTSALFFIPAYFITLVDVRSVNTKIGLVLFGIIAILNTNKILNYATNFSERYSDYSIESTDTGLIFFIIMVAIFLLTEVVSKALYSYECRNKICNTKEKISIELRNINSLISINYIAVCLWCMRLISRTAERPSLFYLPITAILLSKLYIGFTKNSRNLFFIFVIICLVSLFLYRMRNFQYAFI